MDKPHPSITPPPSAERKQTLLVHLSELRRRLIVSSAAVVIAFVIVFVGFSEELLAFLSQPLRERDVLIIHTGLAETFTTQLKASLIAGIVLASPVVIWQIWAFLKPALYPNERAAFRTMFLLVVTLFISGVLFAYLLVFNLAINFFLISGEGIATPMISIDRYISTLLSFVVPFGLMFELPVVVVMLHRLGLVSVQSLSRARKYVVFGVFVVSAVITPPDLISQMMLAVPICILYEASIVTSRIIPNRKS